MWQFCNALINVCVWQKEHSCYKTEKAMIVYSEIKTYAQFIPGSNK